jgi:hypothetical protein
MRRIRLESISAMGMFCESLVQRGKSDKTPMPDCCVAYSERRIRHQVLERAEVYLDDMLPDGETREVLQW